MRLLYLLWLFTISTVLGRPVLFRRSPAPGDSSDSSDSAVEPLRVGSYVGVKAKHYEGVTKENRKGPPHPGVVIGIHHDQLRVAMISNNHPFNPPQIPISVFHPQSNLQGNVNLQAKVVDRSNVKYPWQGANGHMPPRPVEHLSRFVDNPTLVPPHLLVQSPSTTLPHHPIANGPSHPAHPLPPRPIGAGGGGHYAISSSQAPLHHSLPQRPIAPQHPPVGVVRRPSPPSNSRGPVPYDSARRPVHGTTPHPQARPPVHHPNYPNPVHPVYHPPVPPARHGSRPAMKRTLYRRWNTIHE